MNEYVKKSFRHSLVKRKKNIPLRRFFVKKEIITVDSKSFSALFGLKDNRLTLEYRPVCVREGVPLGDWTFDEAEADSIAREHRIANRHATTVQIRN